MIPRWLPLALFAIVFAPSFLSAQEQRTPIRLEPYRLEAKIALLDVSDNNDKMYEDIEILRRILDRKLQPLYQRVQHTSSKPVWVDLGFPMPTNTSFPNIVSPYATNNAYGNTYRLPQQTVVLGLDNPSSNFRYLYALPNNAPAAVTTEETTLSSLEGVYLKGQGIVYTATLTSLQSLAKTEAAKKPVSEWESVRREVCNEKEKPKKLEATKPPSLSDVLLKVLAENGHNLSQLGDNESLTIIITVHNANPPSPPAKSEKGSTKTETKSTAIDVVVPDFDTQVRDLELLGELHLKQGKHAEAIKTYHKALNLKSGPKHEAELHRKLAQCYLMQGQDEKARAELDQAITLMKREKEAKAKPAPTAKPAPILPVKLIISAPKKLLDQVKEGKITFEEFRRQAQVETLRFDNRR